MHFRSLTIVIPVKAPLNIESFIKENHSLLEANKLIVIDSGGGAPLKKFADEYVEKNVRMWEARKLGYSLVETDIILNLDCDNVPPPDYVDEAHRILENDEAEAVAIDFEKPMGHLGFGCSMWKTEILRKLYTYPPAPVEKLIKVGKQQWVTAFQSGFCECTYMWRQLVASGGRLAAPFYRARHLRGSGF